MKTITKISLILLVIGLLLSVGIFAFAIWWTVTFGTGANPPPSPLPVWYVPVLMNLGYVLIEAGAISFLVGVVLSKETKQARANGNAH